ncbi:kinesin-like protein KIN-14E [Clupea harengus]|uniref:Kinesin-like protein n=1 Tax=Clupea harengus TaxID=7950 RepID=A0A8M1KJQ7_CLUHA|nr:kinesin-like protein KIN-14E [Clupea harengus]
MYLNSPGTENVCMSLNFMGKKLRNHTVAPATKPRAWETTTLSTYTDETVGRANLVRTRAVMPAMEDLPGSVPDLRADTWPCRPCAVHNTHLDQDGDTGKIRVFCRIRPMSRTETARGDSTIVSRLDEYSITVETARGQREFQFDRIFDTKCSQEEVFQDTNSFLYPRLIQSAIDGFNVCIFAYGQTGSGKTFTMVGGKNLKNPGIIPRTFNTIFDIIHENEAKFDIKVSAYMMELYNDRLQDLFVSPAEAFAKRIEMKKDKKGLVFAQGAETKEAASASELFALFEQGCANRHIAATKMNVESSRSHLIIGIMMESRNLTNGSVCYGKLSLVDLAGSERAAKTGAKDSQLKEANSINKSLSALGDVISALSSEQQHVPYRNNKLTQAMQDSLGGNAKTLMFVNISPSDCNVEETLTSLMYATRVKAITNNAQRNMDSKEIAQLKEMIVKLRSGQPVEEEEV